MPRKPLVGNWYEEEAYERDRKRLMQGRSGGMVDTPTEVAHIMAKLKHHQTPATLAPLPDDGLLHFYSPVMLQNAKTLGFLSVDLDDRHRAPTGWQVDCSTAPATEATRRNTFLLVPAPMPPTDSYPIPPDEEDVVHYGQPLYLMTLPELCDDPLSLMSEFKSPSSASKVSGRFQYVCFSPDGGSAAAMWCLDYADADFQEDMRDRPVKAEDIFFFRHNMTNAPLVSVKETFYNDFGPQFEVGCGRLTTYASKRKAGPFVNENYWIFVHAGQGRREEVEAASAGSGNEAR